MGKNIRDIIKNMPLFSKQNIAIYFKGKINTLNAQIKYAFKTGDILKLKNGLYISNDFYIRSKDKDGLREYVASQLKSPSYLSKEYVMQKYNLLTEAIYGITSVTLKTRKQYQNFLGSFIYSSIKKDFYFGYNEKRYLSNIYFEADKSKAVFDYLYLKKNIGSKLKQEILEDLRINWENFSKEDFNLFYDYCLRSKSKKMKRIASILKKSIYK